MDDPPKRWHSRHGRRYTEEHCLTQHYTRDQVEFMMAMEKFQREHGRYADCRDVLNVAKVLGYRKVTENDHEAP